MEYAIIKNGGKQYKVSLGDVIEIDRLKNVKDENVTFEDVLLLVSDNKIKIGKPFVSGVKVIGKIVANTRGEKIRVSKFKSKVRFRRVSGFKASLTKIRIEKINEFKDVKTAPREKSNKKK